MVGRVNCPCPEQGRNPKSTFKCNICSNFTNNFTYDPNHTNTESTMLPFELQHYISIYRQQFILKTSRATHPPANPPTGPNSPRQCVVVVMGQELYPLGTKVLIFLCQSESRRQYGSRHGSKYSLIHIRPIYLLDPWVPPKWGPANNQGPPITSFSRHRIMGFHDHFSSGIFSLDIFSSAFFRPHFFVRIFSSMHFFVAQFFVLHLFVGEYFRRAFVRPDIFPSMQSFVRTFILTYF